MPSQQPNQAPVSLQGPPADVHQYGPSEDLVIGDVQFKPVGAPDPTPVVEVDDDGNITIK